MKIWQIIFCVYLGTSTLIAHQAARYAEGVKVAQLGRANVLSSDMLSDGKARELMGKDYPSDPHNMVIDPNNPRVKESVENMKGVVNDQLSSNRYRIDPNTDPIFINGNKALENPEETLDKQTVVHYDDDDYETVECIDTRDEEFDIVNYARIDPYYKRFEVHQFYNHCPNHSGWGKNIAKGCQTWSRPELMHTTRNHAADFEEIHGMEWKIDKHPSSDELLSTGKCYLKQEMSNEEGKNSRMVPVDFYKKEETRTDWNISKIDDFREGRERFKRPEDFGVESFSKVQVYTCSYSMPGNTCNAIRAIGGIEQSSSCIEKMGHVCVKWKKVYQTPKVGAVPQTKITQVQGSIKKPFNMDGVMNDKTFDENTEGPEAIARLKALREVGEAMPKFATDDPEALRVFNGEDLRCVTQGGKWSHHGCPGQRGKKDPHEVKLEKLHNEGKCIIVGSYEEKDKNIGTLIGQNRTVTTYCCFESILSKVLQQGAIDQGKKQLGDPKSPNCQALTLGQLQTMEWDRVDFSPFVSETMSRVNLNADYASQKSATTVRNHLSNQMITAHNGRLREQALSQTNPTPNGGQR